MGALFIPNMSNHEVVLKSNLVTYAVGAQGKIILKLSGIGPSFLLNLSKFSFELPVKPCINISI